MPSYTTETIGDLIDGDYTLRVNCEASECYHHAVVDLEKLAGRLGRGHRALHDDVKPLFRCAKCGSKNVSFTLSPGGGGALYSPPSKPVGD